jgi:hypothetical protein
MNKTMTETQSKEVIDGLAFLEPPQTYARLLFLMLPCFFGSDVFEETEPIVRNYQVMFLLKLRELLSNTKEEIIKKFPEFLKRYDDLEFNRNTLIECYAQYVRGEDFGGTAVGFNDLHGESYGAMELIDLFKQE